MNGQLKRTALLVFSLSAKAEVERKGIFKNRPLKSAFTFHSNLISQTEVLAKSSTADVVWIDEKQQIGNCFADRLANAYQDLFNQGYDQVLSIGNDCPDLTHQLLATALEDLSSNGIVAGPASDGGVYLLGYDRNQFDFDDFKNLPWKQSTLYTAVCTAATASNVPLNNFPVLLDLDTYQDLIEYLSSGANDTIMGIIYMLLFSSINAVSAHNTALNFCSVTLHTSGLRGPPIF